jgi:tetratricopeptide (TPR) repeat protein
MKTMHSAAATRQTAVPVCILILGSLLIVPVLRGIEARRGDPGPDPDLLYFSSPSVVKKMAMGYDQILADIYWMRTIQYFGRRDEADRRTVRYKNLATLLDITTTLDPGLIDAYRTGAIFLGENEPVGAGQPEEAVKLLDKGIEANPNVWRLRFDQGLVYYLYLSDFDSAGRVWLEASRRPESPEWMSALAAKAFSQGDSMDLARSLWQQQYEETTRADIRENARNRLVSLQVAEDLWTLEYLLQAYRTANGKYPRSLSELSSPTVGKLPTADPLGTPYRYDPESGSVSLSPQTKVHYLEVSENYKADFLKNLLPK